MQQRIESILPNNLEAAGKQLHHVHPYCLALDNLNIAIHSLVQDSYLVKNRETGNLRHAAQTSHKSLVDLERQLLQYCNLMPFQQYYYLAVNSKL